MPLSTHLVRFKSRMPITDKQKRQCPVKLFLIAFREVGW